MFAEFPFQEVRFVAAALEIGSPRFYSLDHRQRALAKKSGRGGLKSRV